MFKIGYQKEIYNRGQYHYIKMFVVDGVVYKLEHKIYNDVERFNTYVYKDNVWVDFSVITDLGVFPISGLYLREKEFVDERHFDLIKKLYNFIESIQILKYEV
jgi:hypothetical protein